METRYWRPDLKPTPDTDTEVVTSEGIQIKSNEPGSLAFARVERAAKQIAMLERQLVEPAELLQAGEVIAFPTETVYGLGGDATNSDAIAKIYRAKGRPSDNPLIVHIATRAQLDRLVVNVPPIALPLMDAFWPGPLTLVLPATSTVSPRVTAGLSTVAVRMPNHPIALALIRKSDVAIAAPSANASGRPSPTCARHVSEDLHGRIAGIVDGALVRTRLRDAIRELHSSSAGSSARPDVADVVHTTDSENLESECAFGVESTVLDISQFCESSESTQITSPKAYILRPGAVTKAMLERILPAGTVEYDPTLPIDPAESLRDHASAVLSTSGSVSHETKSEASTPFGDAESALRAELAARANASSGDLQRTAVGSSSTPKAPGMKYVHYAPRAPLYIVMPMASPSALATSPGTSLWKQMKSAIAQGYNHIGVLLTGESMNELGLVQLAKIGGVTSPSFSHPRLELEVERATGKPRLRQPTEDGKFEEGWVIVTALYCGSRHDLNTVSVRLYDALREFDTCGVEAIFAESLDSRDQGAAVMNRLLKAAGGKVILADASEQLELQP